MQAHNAACNLSLREKMNTPNIEGLPLAENRTAPAPIEYEGLTSEDVHELARFGGDLALVPSITENITARENQLDFNLRELARLDGVAPEGQLNYHRTVAASIQNLLERHRTN